MKKNTSSAQKQHQNSHLRYSLLCNKKPFIKDQQWNDLLRIKSTGTKWVLLSKLSNHSWCRAMLCRYLAQPGYQLGHVYRFKISNLACITSFKNQHQYWCSLNIYTYTIAKFHDITSISLDVFNTMTRWISSSKFSLNTLTHWYMKKAKPTQHWYRAKI